MRKLIISNLKSIPVLLLLSAFFSLSASGQIQTGSGRYHNQEQIGTIMKDLQSRYSAVVKIHKSRHLHREKAGTAL